MRGIRWHRRRHRTAVVALSGGHTYRDEPPAYRSPARIAESRRIRIAYLDTWPDTPHLDVYRELSERFIERNGPLNAPASVLFGLSHEDGHVAQFRDVRAQAAGALAANAIRYPSLPDPATAGD